MELADGSNGGLLRLDTTTGKVEPGLVRILVVGDDMLHETVRLSINTFRLDTRDRVLFKLISGGLVLWGNGPGSGTTTLTTLRENPLPGDLPLLLGLKQERPS